jgi:Homeodomain-like domain-containing protein
MAVTSVLKAEQELAAVEARRRGESLDEIAKNLGISRRTAARRVTAGYQAMGASDADQIRREIEDRLDSVLRRVSTLWSQPDLSLGDVVRLAGVILQVERDRTRLLGVAVPPHVIVEHEVNGGTGVAGAAVAAAANGHQVRTW